jgi:hypothetical protein
MAMFWKRCDDVHDHDAGPSQAYVSTLVALALA